ncbi:MAG: SufE family protein [Chlamydiae bacterium]|nr:SufE family protein [Chlamydiota bacterium]
MSYSCLTKQEEVKKLFTSCKTAEERYELIISLGRKTPAMNPIEKNLKNLVEGCQSKLYLHASFKEGVLEFSIDSDALISKGLAAVLLMLYDKESPEIIIKHPPTVLAELGIFSSLSPTRVNGLKSLYLKMQKIALQYVA